MSATYHRTPNPSDREITISQRSLAFVASLVALLGSLFSAGIAYGVMRAQLDAMLDRSEHVEAMQGIDRRISRDSSVLRFVVDEIAELKAEARDTKQRTTDIACDLVRPRRAYCR